MLATIPSATLLGVEGRAITVEVQVANGLPRFTVVGLPDASCREARDRVRAARLEPAAVAKPAGHGEPGAVEHAQGEAGSTSRWPSLSWWLAKCFARRRSAGMAFVGELGLDGTLRRVPGVVPLVDAIRSPLSWFRRTALGKPRSSAATRSVPPRTCASWSKRCEDNGGGRAPRAQSPFP